MAYFIKKLILVMFIFDSVPLLAGGPLYRQKEPSLQLEFENVYNDIRSAKLSSSTYIQNTTTLQSGSTFYVSSGTVNENFTVGPATGAFLNVSNGLVKVSGSGVGGFRLYVTSNSALTTSGIALGADNNKGLITTNGATTTLEIQANATTVISSFTSAGEITQPLQPSFLVTNSAAATDVTGDGTAYTTGWDTEVFDQGSDFASNTFTAPRTGRYLLTATILPQNFLAAHNDRNFKITTSNRVYNMNRNYALAETNNTMTVTVLADMDAGDTAVVTITISGSTKTIDIIGNATLNFFSGSLIN